MAEVIQGYIDHIIYRKPENGFTVLVLQSDDEVVVTGVLPELDEGENVRFEGEYVTHAVYGEQFAAKSCEITDPEGAEAIERYLAGGSIKGIGASTAKKIVKKFGADTFRIMEEEPERLAEIKGISERIARSIGEQMIEKRAMRSITMLLTQLGLSMNLSMKIIEQYGSRTVDIIKANPYKLVEDIKGVGFATADEIAKKTGIPQDSEFRLHSGILYVLLQAGVDGHMYLPKDLLLERAAALLTVTKDEVELQAGNLLVEKKLMSVNTGEEDIIFSTRNYYMERNCARLLSDLDVEVSESTEVLRRQVNELENKNKIVLDEGQRAAVIMAAASGVCVITGGPGTGKTTIIKLLLEYFENERLTVLLAAPTGRAAKRMSEATGYEAKTIHRMLEMGGEDEGMFGRNSENPLEADVVIVDEMSMVDIYLFHSLLKAISIGTRLIMVGDASQLPSVGPGMVLKDIIASGGFKVSVLDRIFRQSEKSDIVTNAHSINHGRDIALDNNSQDFFFLERHDAQVIIEGIIYLIMKKLPPYVDAKPFDIQVLTPMRKGVLGVENLNRVLQERMNPADNGKMEVLSGDTIFRCGDKVMQVKNNYQLEWEIRTPKGMLLDSGLGVFNGDMGIIEEVDTAGGSISVKFDDGRCARYTTAVMDELELAYAITIHKSQGSEYPAIILPLLSGPAMLMSRNLLYTAITRAKKCVTIIGSSDTVRDMIANESELVRYTYLKSFIKEDNI